MRSLALVLAFALCASTNQAAARDYGLHGAVWSIAEPDLLEQIHARLTHLEASGETARLNAALQRRTVAKVERPDPVSGLAHATTTRTWTFDPTITVSADIRDARGVVIIARGTKVNPLDTVPLRSPLVFLGGDDPAALDWAAAKFGKRHPKVILVSGAPLALMKARQMRVFFDQGGTLVRHFGIRAVPAVVEQKGRVLQITEQALKPAPARAS
ncbi:type-F conjugative transfer system protein TraW [Novosphingobium sp. PASSN1]|uniref:type-F conjugative transfer system protein TraW n=1 Tax=Novosphingobium sp. PASSN1 TaxID=2015561 RepID=UPI000BCED3D1|nr:type-F conjugative transfer system protein TraW [Novosphingobium sp. PASSN1]OYU37390.1 MAG: type-F conjugative transfer system protein TraW [Novosphingobium sp. PASSN1]